jgi:dCTP deaminase
MSVLSDKEIKKLSERSHTDRPLIHPFVPETIREEGGSAILSYGLGPEGYDVRAKTHGKLANKNFTGVLSVADTTEDAFVEVVADEEGWMIIPAGSLLLVHTKEYFILPPDVMMVVFTKSKFARCGLSLNTTKAVPGWQGHLLVEIQNNMPFPVKFNVHHGVATMVFLQLTGDSRPYEGQFQGDNNHAVSAVR